MKEVLEFIFQDGWHFLGTILLICVIGDAITGILGKQ